MTGLTDYTAKNVLNYIVGKTAVPALPTTYLALFTGVGSDAGTGFTEVSGGGYARVALAGDWNAASGSAPSTITNGSTISFPTSAGAWGTAIAWGIYDAPTGGNLLAWDYLGNYQWLPCTISSASPGVFSSHAHGYSVADTVVFSTEYGGSAPSFAQSNLTGLLAVAHAATDTFDVTNGGTQVNTSSTGDGLVRKVASQVVSGANVIVFFAASTLTISAA